MQCTLRSVKSSHEVVNFIVSGYEPGDKLVIWNEGGRLMGQMVPLLPIEIFFESRAKLFSRVNPYDVCFDFGPDGQASELTVTEDGVPPIKAMRIQSVGQE